MSESQPTKKREVQRNYLNKFIDAPVNYLIKHNVTPNQLTFLGLALMIGAAICIGLGIVHQIIIIAWPAPTLIFLAGAVDVLDGEVARRTGKEGPAGAFLDSNIDRISDAVLIIGMVIGGLLNYFFGFIILFLSIMISYTRSRAENEGVEMRGVGLMERAERILTLFGVLILETWIYFMSGVITSIISGTPNPWIFDFPLVASRPITPFFLIFILVYTALLLITVLQRIIHTFKELKKKETSPDLS